MSNNKNTITTIPLAASLNMNRNQNVVSSSYDQLNKQNSPLYGGCISPLHTGRQYTKASRSFIDKYGHRWYYSGTSLYQSDENDLNTQLMQTFSTNYVFSDRILDIDADSACWFGGSLYYVKIDGSTITLYKEGQVLYTRTSTNSNYANARVVNRLDKIFLIAVEEIWSAAETTQPLRITIKSFVNDVDTGINGEKYFGLHLAKDNTWQNTSLPNHSIGNSEATTKNTYPIIVGAGILKAGIGEFGITILNRHQNGENILSNGFGYCNFIWYDYRQRFVSDIRMCICPNVGGNIIYPTSVVRPYNATGGSDINVRTLADGSKEYDWQNSNATLNSMNAGITTNGFGIFLEDSTWVFMGNYRPDGFSSQYGQGADPAAYNFIGMAQDFNSGFWGVENAGGYPRPGTNQDTWWEGLSDGVCVTPIYRSDNSYGAAVYRTTNDNYVSLHSIASMTLTTNQYHHRMILAGDSMEHGYNDTKIHGSFWMVDSMAPSQVRAFPGVLSTSTIPTTTDGWKKVFDNRYIDGQAFYNTSGSCTQVGKWRMLFNYREGYISGISFNNGVESNEGTLVTAWDEVDDGFVVAQNGDRLIYKDISGKIHQVTAIATTQDNLYEATDVVNNRYIVIKCDSSYNMYDLVEKKWSKFASDWNNRILQGYTAVTGSLIDQVNDIYRVVAWNTNKQAFYSKWYSTASWASGFNVAYQASKAVTPSRLLPYVTGNYVYTGSPIAYGVSRVKKEVYGSSEKMTLDYFCSSGTSSPMWYSSFYSKGNAQMGSSDDSGSLQGTAYPITTAGSLYNNLPIVGIKFVNSYNGKFAVQVNKKGYNILYDGVRPVMMYNTTSVVDDIKEFFIVQSQTYAVVDSYICAISYSTTNVINGIEQLVDVNGMQFVGSFPSVAYFYSPSNRALFAFTGDADLQLFVQTDRISTIYDHLYAPNNEWIYLATNDGLYVLTQQNVFRISYDSLGITSPSTIKMFMTDDAWNVIQHYDSTGWTGIKIRLDRPSSSWTTVPVEVETEFFGPGDGKQEVIDTWYIRVYKGDEDDNGTVACYNTTLTDIVKKGQEVTETITPDKWDDNNNAFIRFQPDYQMTQGSSLHIKSSYPIAWLAFSHQQDSTAISHLNI